MASARVWLCFTKAIVKGDEFNLKIGLIVSFMRFWSGKRALFLAKRRLFCSTAIFLNVLGAIKCFTSSVDFLFKYSSVILVKYLMEVVLKIFDIEFGALDGQEFGHVTRVGVFFSIGGLDV